MDHRRTFRKVLGDGTGERETVKRKEKSDTFEFERGHDTTPFFA